MKPRSSIVHHTVLAVGTLLCTLAQPALSQTGMPASASIEVAGVETVMTMRVDGELVFDTEGRVIEHRVITPKLNPALAKLADEAMAKMRFEPVIIAGKPVNARTFTRMTLVGRDLENGDFSVGIDNVLFFKGEFSASGAPKTAPDEPLKTEGFNAWTVARRSRQPVYPVELMRAGVSGAVSVRVLIREDGSVENAFVTQSALFNVRGRDQTLERARQQLEKTSLAAIRTWRFNPPEERGEADDPAWRSGNLSVFFTMDADPDARAGRWRVEQRGPRRVAVWEAMRDTQRLVGVSDMDGDEGMMEPDPRIKRIQ